MGGAEGFAGQGDTVEAHATSVVVELPVGTTMIGGVTGEESKLGVHEITLPRWYDSETGPVGFAAG
jgi:hypothetical protein